MAARWSTESVSAEFRDLQANTLAVDYSEKLALLAGRKALAIVELDKPLSISKRHVRQSKWEVSTAEWNPSSHNSHIFAIACNQRAELWTCIGDDFSNQTILKYHTRAISDLQWSLFDVNRLATCSVDTFVYIWDIRDSKKPAVSLCAVAGAGQVKWNKFNDHTLATSHDGDVRIWDDRKGSSPLQYIAAHLSKIHGLDWSSSSDQEHMLATSSQDCTVKFWNVNEPCRPVKILKTTSPVWRARYTPFGNGLVTVVVPQLRRGENSLLLWNTNSLNVPVHTFMGHSDVVLEFQWRRHTDAKEYQLITWSKDQNLRIWKIDQQLQKLCYRELDRYDSMEKFSSALDLLELVVDNPGQSSVTSSQEHDPAINTQDPTGSVIINAFSSSIHSEPGMELAQSELDKADPLESRDSRTDLSKSRPNSLQQEFKLLNSDIANLRIEDMDEVSRTFICSISSGICKVRIKLEFPTNYPFNIAPDMDFCGGTNVGNNILDELLKTHKFISQMHVKNNHYCLEPCLRNIATTFETLAAAEQKEVFDVGSPYKFASTPSPSALLSLKTYASYQDSNVPFPRTCGATFGGANFLICFARPSHMKGLRTGSEVTPRALSAISAYTMQPHNHQTSTSQSYSYLYPLIAHSPTGDANPSLSSLYYVDKRHKLRGKFRKDDSQNKYFKMGFVTRYEISKLLSISKELALAYSIDDKDIKSMCQKNMEAAASVGRKDLVLVWSLVSLLATPDLPPNSDTNFNMPWACHPFGRDLYQSLINHYLLMGDIQSVVMLCCTLSPFSIPHSNKKSSSVMEPIVASQPTGKWWLKPGGSPYHTIHPGDTLADGRLIGTLLKSNRSNSWSECIDDYDNRVSLMGPKEIERERHESSSRMLDPKLSIQYDEFKRIYAEILYRWNLLETRASILKNITTLPDTHKRTEFLVNCFHCQSTTQGVVCENCKKYCLQCAVCRLAIKGSFNFCVICGHGGHATHMMQWFQVQKFCPTGCGCNCLIECGLTET